MLMTVIGKILWTYSIKLLFHLNKSYREVKVFPKPHSKLIAKDRLQSAFLSSQSYRLQPEAGTAQPVSVCLSGVSKGFPENTETPESAQGITSTLPFVVLWVSVILVFFRSPTKHCRALKNLRDDLTIQL